MPVNPTPTFITNPNRASATDGTEVFGRPNDLYTPEGRLMAHIWGHQPDDQEFRGSAWTHLHAIPAGDRTYDLRKIEDMRDFLNDLADGHLDGKSEKKGFQGVTVSGEGKVLVGDKAYDLTNPADVQALLRDNADGRLDGTIGAPVDDVDPPPVSAPQPETNRPQVPFMPVDVFPVGYPAPTTAPADPAPADVPAPTRGKPNPVMFDGEIYDVATEEGREALEERLEAEGIDYDKNTNEVTVGDRTYDLNTEKGRRGFLLDGKDGLVDGHWGDHARNIVYDGNRYDTKTEKGRKELEKAIEGYGVEYDRSSNTVKVGGKSYDLDTEKGRLAFQNDLKDGVLDGRAAKEPARKPAEKKVPERVAPLEVLRPLIWTTPDSFVDAGFRFIPQRA